jgi:hypothetical protein
VRPDATLVKGYEDWRKTGGVTWWTVRRIRVLPGLDAAEAAGR